MTNKQYGRVGDSPIIGAGTYARNATCALSATGHGEFFIRTVFGHNVSALMEYRGLSLAQAAAEALRQMAKLGGTGGLVAIDRAGPDRHAVQHPRHVPRAARGRPGAADRDLRLETLTVAIPPPAQYSRNGGIRLVPPWPPGDGGRCRPTITEQANIVGRGRPGSPARLAIALKRRRQLYAEAAEPRPMVFPKSALAASPMLRPAVHGTANSLCNRLAQRAIRTASATTWPGFRRLRP